jgi:NhaP-type Na+/H+ or K+/H+ antiporter
LRFTLTSEAGMNDGSAFPFVMLGLGLLGLHELGDFGLDWVLMDVIWATVGGIALGVAAGAALALVGWKLRRAPAKHVLLDDFLGLGLIGVVYSLSVTFHVWGFLAVFFAAVALRQTEMKLASATPRAEDECIPDDAQHGGHSVDAPTPPPLVSEGSLVFKEHLERLSEVILILLIGGTLFVDSWTWKAVGLALFLFMVARPVGVLVSLVGTRTPMRMQGLTGWFGVRGIGSLYYLMYAIQHGLPEPLALEMIRMTLIVLTLSIILHGISVKPMLARFWRRKQRRSVT